MLKRADIQLTNWPTTPRASVVSGALPQVFFRFIKFCIVGGTGLGVDTAMLYLLADPTRLGWNIILSKICAAEVAMMNNFIWNEFWTFRFLSAEGESRTDAVFGSALHVQPSPRERCYRLFGRFLVFNGICGAGMALAVFLLYLLHQVFGWSLYFSNFVAVILATFWNFGMNSRLNWRTRPTTSAQGDEAFR